MPDRAPTDARGWTRSDAPATVVFDADSTLAGIEGIDWLAALRPRHVAERIAAMTAEAMAGRIALEAVYAERMRAVAPTRGEIDRLGAAYVCAVAPGALECVRALQDAGVRPLVVSGGVRDALLPLAAHLGIPSRDVHAVDVYHHASGEYRDFDFTNPLTASDGKPRVVAGLPLDRPIVAVGDGMTDLLIRTRRVADGFVAFTGYEAREAVVRGADATAATFAELTDLLLSRR